MRRSGILPRIVLLTSAVAAIAVLVAGLVSFPLVRSNAQALAVNDLSQLADLTATALRVEPGGEYFLPPRVAAVLQSEQVKAYVVGAGARDLPAGVTPADVETVTKGGSLTRTIETGSGSLLIVGRPFERGTGVILIQPSDVAGSSAGDVLLRLAVALAIGLAIAIVIAVIAARRITRPLRDAAEAANRLGGGERGVVVEPEGPAEVANIAESLNRLSAALAVSEGRQREFLLSVSHELRTPITSVRGYAEALADGLVVGEEVPRTGAVLAAEAQRLDRLVSDLLDLARLRADDFRVTPISLDLGQVGRDAALVWSDRCERAGVVFRSEIPDARVEVLADPLRLRQVIDNLAENALRVTPAGGLIVLAVRSDAEWGIVEIRDSGPGLSQDDLEVAFEPGILHERYRGLRPVGTGLGLALVGRLAARMGGWAQAGNAPEGGADFSVGVPLDTGATQGSAS